MATTSSELKIELDRTKQQEIVMFLMGQFHEDANVLTAISEKIDFLIAQKIPVSIGMECSEDRTLDELISRLDDKIMKNVGLLDTPKEKMSRVVLENIMALASDEAVLALLEKIKANKIPFFGLDYKQAQLATIAPHIKKHEPERMLNMADKALKASSSLSSDGGCLFVIQLGNAHAQRLAVNIMTSLKNYPLLSNCTVHAIPIVTVPDDMEEASWKKYKEEILASRKGDPSVILEAYKSLPSYEFKFVRIAEERVYCREFDVLFKNSVHSLIEHRKMIAVKPTLHAKREASKREASSEKTDLMLHYMEFPLPKASYDYFQHLQNIVGNYENGAKIIRFSAPNKVALSSYWISQVEQHDPASMSMIYAALQETAASVPISGVPAKKVSPPPTSPEVTAQPATPKDPPVASATTAMTTPSPGGM